MEKLTTLVPCDCMPFSGRDEQTVLSKTARERIAYLQSTDKLIRTYLQSLPVEDYAF